METDKVLENWKKFLNPDVLKPHLLLCTIFITVYEMLKDTVIERLVEFYSDGFDTKGLIRGHDYENKVLALDEKRNPLRSSLTWHSNKEIIDSSDLDSFHQMSTMRNELTHRLLKSLTDVNILEIADVLSQMISLIDKIERWWIINYELELNPISDADEIDYEGIIPSAIQTIRLLVDIALGDKCESETYYKEFTKLYK